MTRDLVHVLKSQKEPKCPRVEQQARKLGKTHRTGGSTTEYTINTKKTHKEHKSALVLFAPWLCHCKRRYRAGDWEAVDKKGKRAGGL